MKTIYTKYNYIIAPSSRPTGGFFISVTFLKKTRAELTTEVANSLMQKKIINKLAKVNKPVLNGSNTINYNGAIFPEAKAAPTKVNKLNEVSSMKPLKTDTMNELNTSPYYPINLLPYYPVVPNCPVILLTHCHINQLPYYPITALTIFAHEKNT